MEYGLIGERLGHSFSKEIHKKIADYSYELKEIKKEDIEIFLKEKDFKGINVTIPYKETVISYLDEISNEAKEIGAVNTIVNKNGKLIGYNTDFLGLKALILKNNIQIKNKKVLILGSGGTSKTAEAVAKSLKAKEILKVSRSGGKSFLTYKEAEEFHNDADVLINTTPCGMFPNVDAMPIGIDKFPNLSGVVDVIYNPLSTKLLLSAKDDAITCGGLYMLVSQAVFAAEKFLEKEIDGDIFDRIYTDILKEKQNIVLIGMPSCGKSTVGKKLAKKLNRSFFDTDELIEKEANMEISHIFSKFGEEYFRNMESKVIKEVSKKSGVVIATGGGAILRKENIEALKSNGKIYFLDRPLEKLEATEDRPLTSNISDLKKKYDERYPIYLKLAEKTIDARGTIEDNIKLILEDF